MYSSKTVLPDGETKLSPVYRDVFICSPLCESNQWTTKSLPKNAPSPGLPGLVIPNCKCRFIQPRKTTRRRYGCAPISVRSWMLGYPAELRRSLTIEWCFFHVAEYRWHPESPIATMLLFLMKGSPVTYCRQPDTTVGPKTSIECSNRQFDK